MIRQAAAGLSAEVPLLLSEPVHLGGDGSPVGCTPRSLAAHSARHGVPVIAPADLAAALELAELTGRGGAHLPVIVKWRSVRQAGQPPMVVANCAEGEPLSRKDAVLLQTEPHLVLDGIALAAAAVGATEAVIWLHEGAHGSRSALTRALAERAAAQTDPVAVRVATGPDHYLTGESSAVVRALSGGPALPTFRRVPSTVSGVDGRPTLIHNVETLARVALLARGKDAGATALVTVAGRRGSTVLEVSRSATLRDVVRSVSDVDHPPAVLLGGYGGRWVPSDRLGMLRVGEAELRANGLTLGAGVLMPLPPDECGLARTAQIARYLADAGAGQCGPCRFGLPAIADALDSVIAGGRGHSRRLAKLETYLSQVDGRGACHHPDGAVALVASALDTFAPDVEAHRRGRCLQSGRSA